MGQGVKEKVSSQRVKGSAREIPSMCLRTVQTALGLPGSSDTAISDTCGKEETMFRVSPHMDYFVAVCHRLNTATHILHFVIFFIAI